MQTEELIQWLVLALVQGITEYLPVSSSAHLILVPAIMDWKDQGLMMDIAAHGGSLLAVMWYFKKEILELLTGQKNKLFIQLVIATIPLALIGVLTAGFIENNLRSPAIIAISSIIFGVVLFLSEKLAKSKNEITTKNAFLIGVGQVLALIPGASRSGVTMTTAMLQGYSKTQAAKFSFLLAIPALLMTTAYGVLKVYQNPEEYNPTGFLIVLVLSFITSLISIKLFLKLIEKIKMCYFMWYRILLGALILWLLR
ncbi:MAG TPA: undecaprenyl-diphosphate phosphatase [Gammaproteobacteria bacterium]|nr:undecaprenyl-diphosphate phosphatase [Xanthomonadales bacterium]MCB1593345.1 undecaprenyl-diphosphate phosphatase [Xanthomonadales bacterium]HOP22122.1 undecaprenyl-diphosphate phosphatase [Gammaproteobacteria bacterium]HPI94616.1 undecaprenyl-diphosphate phosphatase [Gammaproteobacteria bacterium]HPQ86061.1 undecaprenyl-diphosphate phosphatase [Gammaproteobacteria bacterium]